MPWLKPETSEVRAALRRFAPQFGDAPVDFLAEGWEFWAFEAASYVLRFPKNEASVRSLKLDRVLLPELTAHLSVPLPRLDVWGEDGPNGAPFAGHVKLAGTPVWPNGGRASQAMLAAAPRPSAGFGRRFGRLLRELHSFPVERAVALGVPARDANSVRAGRIEQYGEVVRRVFPIVNCETRSFMEAMFLRAINDPACYADELRFVHGDLDVNTLIDEAGEVSGLIDFGQVFVGSAAIDYWLPVYGFSRLGIGDQTQACLDEAGMTAAALERMTPELAFVNFLYPVLDVLYGLETDDRDYVEGGILDLNAMVPDGTVCV